MDKNVGTEGKINKTFIKLKPPDPRSSIKPTSHKPKIKFDPRKHRKITEMFKKKNVLHPVSPVVMLERDLDGMPKKPSNDLPEPNPNLYFSDSNASFSQTLKLDTLSLLGHELDSKSSAELPLYLKEKKGLDATEF